MRMSMSVEIDWSSARWVSACCTRVTSPWACSDHAPQVEPVARGNPCVGIHARERALDLPAVLVGHQREVTVALAHREGQASEPSISGDVGSEEPARHVSIELGVVHLRLEASRGELPPSGPHRPACLPAPGTQLERASEQQILRRHAVEVLFLLFPVDLLESEPRVVLCLRCPCLTAQGDPSDLDVRVSLAADPIPDRVDCLTCDRGVRTG